jgi:radical SAM protein with 4Fe4S-binding SPASM domain
MSELTTDSWIKILDYLAESFSPLPVVVLTGGEPTIHKDLTIITEALSDRGFPWGMVTNGMSMTEKRLDTLISHGIASITVSFDGNRESTSFIRNSPRAYDRIINTIQIIGRSDIPVRDAVTCVWPGNLGHLKDITDCLLENRMNSHRLFRIFPKGRAEYRSELLLDFDQSRQLVRWIADNRSAYKKQGMNLPFSCEGYLPFALDKQVRDDPFFCRSGINIASILCDGTITGCNNNGPDYYQGNIISDNFLTVWQNCFREYRDKSWLKTGLCENCNEWNYCRGGSVHLRSKSTKGPDFCYIHDCRA